MTNLAEATTSSLQMVFRGAFDMPLSGPADIDMRCVETVSRTCQFYDTHVWSLWFQGKILALEDSWFLQDDEKLT
jgi:hypothetical protein